MKIQMAFSLCSKVKALLSKASHRGGYASFLGYTVNTDGGGKGRWASSATFARVQDSDDTHIRIRAQKNELLVALALHTRRLLAKVV